MLMDISSTIYACACGFHFWDSQFIYIRRVQGMFDNIFSDDELQLSVYRNYDAMVYEYELRKYGKIESEDVLSLSDSHC